MKRIAHIIDNLKVGGAQALLVTFTQQAHARGISVCIIALDHHPETESRIPEALQAAGARVVTFPSQKLFDLSRLLQLVNFLKKERFDVLHSHLAYANILANLAGPLSATPVVSSLHSAAVDRRHYHPLRTQLESLLLRRVAKRVIAVGYLVAETHQRRLGKKRIDVVPNAVNLPAPLAEGERCAVRAEITGHAGRPLLISVGRFSPPKGYFDLLSAFEMIHFARPETALVIVGSGELFDEVKAKVAARGLQDSVFLPGQRSDVPRLLAAADLYVSSSLWEGLPVSILEALAAGLPVVATQVGDIGRIVPPEVGITVPPQQPERLAKAVCQLLDNPADRLQRGQAARTCAIAEHSAEAWIDQLLELYYADRESDQLP